MIRDIGAYLRFFDSVRRRTERDVAALPPEAAAWRPPATGGDTAWGIGDIVGHIGATRLYFAGETTPEGVMRGDLVVRGSGDPTFGSRASGDDPFEAWAEALRDAGVRRIEGRLIGDDDVIEEQPWAEGWDVSHVALEQYAQGVGGLSWGDNLIAVTVRGGSVETNPPGFAVIDGPSGDDGRPSLLHEPERVMDVVQ